MSCVRLAEPEANADAEGAKRAISVVEQALELVERAPPRVVDLVDWVAKERVYEAYMERHGTDWDDVRLKALDLQYADLRPERSLYPRLSMRTLCDPAAVDVAVTEPPTTTRAYFRGKCLQKWPEDVVAANWDSLVFDIGGDPLRRVPMMEPLRGTRDMVGTLLEQSRTAGDLISALDSSK